MTSAAQEEITEPYTLQATGTDGGAALRQTVAERLARHRSRRSAQAHQEAQEAAQRREEVRHAARSGVSRVRDAVAARYENTQSYREYLAAEAERALLQAQAEAEVANRKVRAVEEVQIQLLEELEQWKQTQPSPREQALQKVRTEARGELAHALADIALGAQELIREPIEHHASAELFEIPAPLTVTEAARESVQSRPLTEISAGGLTIKLYDGLEKPKPSPNELRPNRGRSAEHHFVEPEELDELEQELALRHGAQMPPHQIIETTPIPANLIEFPRQLIAPRKARPRLAEGPLREDGSPEPQLRIFEVEAEQIATEAVAEESGSAPVWQELLLESTTAPRHDPPAQAQAEFQTQPQVASLGKRLLSGGVDAACLAGLTACFLEVAFHVGGSGLQNAPLPLQIVAVGGTLLVFSTLYQLLFFTLSESTPGMRAARIALCTFGDDNPTRRAMRFRVLATLLAACPLGIGLFWSFLDDEKLGWHDRMSRMYQRAY